MKLLTKETDTPFLRPCEMEECDLVLHIDVISSKNRPPGRNLLKILSYMHSRLNVRYARPPLRLTILLCLNSRSSTTGIQHGFIYLVITL